MAAAIIETADHNLGIAGRKACRENFEVRVAVDDSDSLSLHHFLHVGLQLSHMGQLIFAHHQIALKPVGNAGLCASTSINHFPSDVKDSKS